MKRKIILLNKELNEFFSKQFPLKKNKFKDTDEILNFYLEIENNMTMRLMNIISNIENCPYKVKQLSQYLLEEKLIVSFDDSNLGNKINKKIQNIYDEIINKILSKVSFNKIIGEKNEKEIVSFLTSEILTLDGVFYEKLFKNFSDRNNFPHFLAYKYERLIKDRYLTIASSNGIDISKMDYNQFKYDTFKLFDSIFIKKEENLFLSKNKDDSYKNYMELILICNRKYLENEEVKEVLFKNFHYLYYLLNLDTINKNKEGEESFLINLLLNQLLKENLEISEEEVSKKLDLILKEIGKDTNKILSIILCLTLIFNGIIIKDKKTKELSLTSNTQNLISSAKMKVILNNSISPFDIYLDEDNISDFCQSTIINSILPQNDNLSYDIREIKKILTNITEKQKKLPDNSEGKDSQINLKKSEISILSESIFESLKVDKKNEISNFLENLNSETKDLNIRSINLQSLNPKIKSTHCIIFVSGFLSDNEDHIEEWENLAINLNKSNICYYYNWPSESIKSTVGSTIFKVTGFVLKALSNQGKEELLQPEEIFVDSSKKAKLCGKILALIIASKVIFKYQTITLIGFSLGTHVISNCIKMLYKINSKIKCDDIIKDVILIAGATSMKGKEEHYAKMFDKIVNGKIINCWSNKDKVLSLLYTTAMNKTPIGYGGDLNLKLDKFKSIDFTDLKLGHTDYRKKMDLVMSKIQLTS